MYQIVEVDGERKVLTTEGIAQKQMEFGDGGVKVIKSLQGATQETVLITLADRFVFFVTSPLISGTLLALGTLGLFVEIRTPGFGIPGIAGLICLGLFFWGHRLLNISADYAALAFILGVALLLIELFVIPGFGVAGIAGIVLMLGSVFFVFRNAYKLETAVFGLSFAIILAFRACNCTFLRLAQNSYMEPSRFEHCHGFGFGISLRTAGGFSGVRG